VQAQTLARDDCSSSSGTRSGAPVEQLLAQEALTREPVADASHW